MNFRVAFSRMINTLLGGRYDEMLSSRAYRLHHESRACYVMLIILDAAFFWDKSHCKNNFEWEQEQRLPLFGAK